MNGADGYRRFQDSTFAELEAKQRIVTRVAVEQFAQYAETKGYTLDSLIKLAGSGMSGAQLWGDVQRSV
jgi:hypothetical protein